MKLLVVEDEKKIALSLKKGFEQESFVCDAVFDGEMGLDLASTSDYDCIILDVMLPGIDGLSLAKKLRSLEIHTPILMLTAKGELDDKLSGFESGVDDYMVKPFAFEELLARVNTITRRPRNIAKKIIKSGELIVDIENKEVSLSGKLLQLSLKEYQLLEYLVKNKSRVVSKEEIISKVWDYDTDILPNTVEVFVKYLRNKVGQNTIRTIRGFGYKIE